MKQTYYMNLVAILVPHGKPSRIGFSNTFPKTMSSALTSLRNRPDSFSSCALLFASQRDGHTSNDNAVRHARPHVKVLVSISTILVPRVSLDPDRDLAFKVGRLDRYRRGRVDCAYLCWWVGLACGYKHAKFGRHAARVY